MDGEGELIYKDGSIFRGTYQEDKKNGQGVYIFANGKKIEGQWI